MIFTHQHLVRYNRTSVFSVIYTQEHWSYCSHTTDIILYGSKLGIGIECVVVWRRDSTETNAHLTTSAEA